MAIDCRMDYCFYASFTLGGLDTLPSGEVLDAERNVIAGLFAAGRTACGLPRWGEGYSSGLSLADATFFGRQAGTRAARTHTLRCLRPRSRPLIGPYPPQTGLPACLRPVCAPCR